MPSIDLQNKSVLITGAGRGIGKRLALGFAQAGARIALLGRTKAEVDLAQIEIEQNGGNALRLQADVCDEKQLTEAVERTQAAWASPIDILVCAATVPGPLRSLLQIPFAEWRDAFLSNIVAVASSCRAVLPSMLKQRRGKIIVLACGSDREPRRNFSAYDTSKAAAVRFVEGLALELADYNIQINCFDPGPAYTNLTDEIIKAEQHLDPQDVAAARETRRTGGCAPDRQFEVAAFLASEESNHVTGRLLDITDDLRRLKQMQLRDDTFKLRRVAK